MSAKQNKSIPESNRVWTPCNFRKIVKELIIEIAHNKYKRCLAMAWWCKSSMDYWYDRIEMEQCPKFKFYERWYKSWLELAQYYGGIR